jgi:hypothetical protein
LIFIRGLRRLRGFKKGKKGFGVLLGFAYNFCLRCLDSGGYFATEDKEKKRGIREKIK